MHSSCASPTCTSTTSAATTRARSQRLMGEHGLREAEVDDLLRRGVFVNLHSALRQALRVGVRSYSLKELEALARLRRARPTSARATHAVVGFESGCGRAKTAAARRDRRLQRGGLPRDARAARLAARRSGPPTCPGPSRSRSASSRRRSGRRSRPARSCALALVEGEEPGTPRWLAGELLEYHRREAKPAWWAWFDRMTSSPEELVEEPEAIGCLEPVGEPEPVKKSLVWTLAFPEQEHKLDAGDEPHDPATGKRAGTIVELDDATLTLRLLRGPGLAEWRCRGRSSAGSPTTTRFQRAAVMRFAESIRDRQRPLPGARGRAAARAAARSPDASRARAIQTVDPAEIAALARGARRELPVRPGPARNGQDVARRRDRRRPRRGGPSRRRDRPEPQGDPQPAQRDRARGGAARRHVRGAEEGERRQRGVELRRRSDRERDGQRGVHRSGGSTRRRHGVAVLARQELDGTLDYLVIDEAGQVSLADAIAVGTSARNLILLGDPLQLAQVSQGTHPPGVGRVGARAPARRRADDPRGPRRLPRGELAHAPRRLRVRLRPRLRGAAALAPDRDRALDLARHRDPLPAGRARGERVVLRPRRPTGSPPSCGAMLGADVHRRGRRDAAAAPRATSWSSRPTTPRCTSSRGRCRRACRSAPSTSSRASRRRSSSSRWRPRAGEDVPRNARVPVLAQSPQRRDLAGAVPRDPRVLAEAARGALPLDRGDAARERALPAGRGRRGAGGPGLSPPARPTRRAGSSTASCPPASRRVSGASARRLRA